MIDILSKYRVDLDQRTVSTVWPMRITSIADGEAFDWRRCLHWQRMSSDVRWPIAPFWNVRFRVTFGGKAEVGATFAKRWFLGPAW
jgi:hypothetical protein